MTRLRGAPLLAALLVLTVLPCCVVASTEGSPIIGIVTQPNDPDWVVRYGARSHINADYAQWIALGGARVAVIPYDAPASVLSRLWSSLNGIFVQGGATELITSHTQYYDNIKLLYNLTLEAAQRGEWVPFWGTCLGFEEIATMAAGDAFTFMGTWDAVNLSLPLRFSAQAKTSRMFGQAPADLIGIMVTDAWSENQHSNGVSPDAWKLYPGLNSYVVLSTNDDRQGLPFVSSIEHKTAPVYGVQFHPERPIFEVHDNEAGNHSLRSMRANQYFSNFFVDECRHNTHHFASEPEQWDAMLWNFAPRLVIRDYPLGMTTQMYLFA